MKYLITGSSGYLGKNFITNINLDKNIYIFLTRKKNKILKYKKSSNIIIIQTDLENYRDLYSKLNNYKADVLINFAWLGATGKYKNNKIQNKNLNIIKNLIKLSNLLGVKKFIGIGSQAEYGNKNYKINEKMKCNPKTLYGKIKLKTYNYLKKNLKSKKINLVWIRLFSSFGLYDNQKWLIPYLINNFLKNKKISVTKCEQKWDFIYSRDVISSTKFLAENKDSKGVYNLGSGLSLNLKEVVLKIKKLTKSSSIINFGGLNYNKNQTMYLLADISKILDLGWKYKPNFNRDIKRLIKYYKK